MYPLCAMPALCVVRMQGLCTSFLTQLEPASAEALSAELARVPGFREVAKQASSGKKDVRHPGGRSAAANEFVLVQVCASPVHARAHGMTRGVPVAARGRGERLTAEWAVERGGVLGVGMKQASHTRSCL